MSLLTGNCQSSGRVFGCIAGFIAGVLLSPTAQALSEADFLEELPVVLSAARLAQPEGEAPAAITIIDRELIEASPALEISDLLRLVPGFQVAQVSGWERSITSHGMADQHARRMQVLVDGRSIYDPVFGGVVWQSIPLSLADVDHIEVVRGPNAASYGSNAFLGVINIVTRKPVGNRGIQARLVAGSQDAGYLDLAQDWLFGGKHGLRLSAGARTHSGFDGLRDTGRSARLNARYSYHPNPLEEVEVLAGVRSTALETGYPMDDIQPERDADYLYHYQQLRWHRNRTDGSDLTLQLYHNHQNLDDRFDVVLNPHWPMVPTYIDRSFSGDRWDAELEWRTAFGSDIRLVAGAGWRKDQGNVPGGITGGSTSRQSLRLFAHGEYRIGPDWLIQGGVMLEDVEDTGQYVSPRLSLTHKLQRHHALRMSAAHGHRLPSLFEQYAFFGLYSALDGSPVYYPNNTYPYTSSMDIGAESITAYELGLIGDLPEHRLDYDIKLFSHRMRHLIDTARYGEFFAPFNTTIHNWVFDNISTMEINGVEVEITAHPAPRTQLHFNYSYAMPEGTELKYYENGVLIPTSIDRLVPRHTLGLLLSHRFNSGISATAAFSHVGKMTWGGDGSSMGVYNRLDLKVGKAMRVGGADVRLDLIVQNALNQPYDEFRLPTSNAAGNVFARRLYGQLSVTSR